MYKQLIIARKDLNMSPGKLAAQVAHGSMAFLTTMIKKGVLLISNHEKYFTVLGFEQGLYEEWIEGSFTKIICEARNKSQLLRAADMARDLDLSEGKDFFLIRDNCLTELEPEDEDGRTLTCIGFKPMDSAIVDKISKKFQLYK